MNTYTAVNIGRRGTLEQPEQMDVEVALRALYDAGLVTNTTALDMAVVALGGARPLLCSRCGRVTRRESRLHVACARGRR